jgi:hypothetical protein
VIASLPIWSRMLVLPLRLRTVTLMPFAPFRPGSSTADRAVMSPYPLFNWIIWEIVRQSHGKRFDFYDILTASLRHLAYNYLTIE